MKDNHSYNNLITNIGNTLEKGRQDVYRAVNSTLVRTYWEIGKYIVEYEQQGEEHAEYGSALLKRLSRDLKDRYGKGFSKSNVYLMRQMYVGYPKFRTVSGKLSWSHYIELLGIEDGMERVFYEKQCILERWSIRELRRQKDSALFHRIALSKDKKGILELAKQGQWITGARDIIRDPYVLEFLNIPEMSQYSEKDLEQRLIDNLQMFLLELGKGFTFVARQFRITLGNRHYYVDLVFYHRILRCFVLIDLKVGKARHKDIGQMNMYLSYFKKEENIQGENDPIGIIFAAYKDAIEVEYALGGINNKIFVSKYKIHLPDKEQLENQLRKIIEET
ncbi:MAG: PDDEXK nuclease domain-containing protein [Candidatus Thermoplasmatota archaeon]|jgi:predicted nuclease of restriction endonuclease-like (RecB) superfamily|nr:PDDEXK nuclease domain-containing protein [Candidatus Thermoplasmatota archaeon]